MIIVRLRGGLGNQLFQYAAGKALAMHHRTALKLDLYTYQKHPYRKFELDKFKVDAIEASRKEVHRFTGVNPIIRYLNKRENYFRCPSVFAQPHYHFYEDFFSLPEDLYLSGYWQSEKYFNAIADVIRKEYTPSQTLDSRNQELTAKMTSENSVSIHVRRGDYSSQHYNNFFGGLTTGYYEEAIRVIKQQVADPVFYFFSDDPAWCRKAFPGIEASFMEHNKGDDSFKDLLLMSSCRHQIVANSTFSWWGAWLNQFEGKQVVAPLKWFQSSYLSRREPVYACRFYNTKDLIPATWTRI
ncbi:MAG: alpha-1,2-fucosyltransferase [Bacteroidetes bacterium]|nr:alpha-1,2-fucosyltransferase [Bacteroidota bacterium]